jgi:release factor glutamine methyltransferase
MTESELLLTSILNCSRADLYASGISLSAPQTEELSRGMRLRSLGIPLQYILGETEFLGLKFKVNANVFIPRPETEILVEEAVKAVSGIKPQVSSIRILDLGTGSGCIAVSLAKFLPEAKITAIDISKDAIEVAKENARLNKVEERIEFLKSDLFTCLPRPKRRGYLPAPTEAPGLAICPDRSPGVSCYDIIVSNPPYIPTNDIKGLQREIHYEPHIALDGAGDGLDFYWRIINEAPKFLKQDGLLMMEMGYGQSSQIKNIFEKTDNFEIIGFVKDYSSIERVVMARNIPKPVYNY